MPAAGATFTTGPVTFSEKVNRCVSLLYDRFGFTSRKSIKAVLEEDGITLDRLYDSTRANGGITRPYIYTTARGERFILKGAAAAKEVASYIVSKKLDLQLVPPTEFIEIEGHFYSAMQFVDPEAIKVIYPDGQEEVFENLALISSNRPSPELLFLDALITNIDRRASGYAPGKNYFIFSNHPQHIFHLAKGERIEIVDPVFMAYDNGQTFKWDILTLDWMVDRGYWDHAYISINEVHTSLRRVSKRVKKAMREWSEDEIKRDLAPYLTEGEIKSFLLRYKQMEALLGKSLTFRAKTPRLNK
jgi:hypothetical protein